MTLSGSGPFRINQPLVGGQIANLSCTLTSTAVFTRSAPPPPPPPINIQWIRQFGATRGDGAVVGLRVAVDATGVYIVGSVSGALPDQSGVSGFDAFVRKYDANGNLLWTRQFGTTGSDFARGVAVDATGVYVVGETGGALPGQTWAGGTDAFARKYDATGNELWTRQFGTTFADQAYGVAVDAAGVYVVGHVDGALPGQASNGARDTFVRKCDANGNVLWTRQFGTASGDSAFGVTVDATGVYVVGQTGGALPGQISTGGTDAFARKYDPTGNQLWTRQFGTTFGDLAFGVTGDATGVYVVGQTGGALPGQISTGGTDAFARKYDPTGNELWTRQFGTTFGVLAWGVTVDATGVYVVGQTGGALPGQISAGGSDAFARKYDPTGNELWTRQFGTTGVERALGVAAHATGVYVVGGATRAGFGEEAFLAKLVATSGGPPAVNDGGVVNNASFAANPARVAPGSVAAVFGSSLNIGSDALFSSFGPDGRLVTSLGGSSVTINNIPAPMFYSTAGQLGIQIPFEMTGLTSATIQVTVGGQTSPPRTIFLDAFAPGIFTLSQDGRGAVAAIHQDGVTPVTAQNPARPGEVVVIFGTGLGALNPPLATGARSSGNRTASTPTVTIDGLPGEVQFSGAAPGFVGLNQVNVRIPPNTRSAPNIPVVLSIGGRQSNSVTIPVSS